MKQIVYILAIAACAAFWSCNTNGCLENRNSVPLAGFYSDVDSVSISLDSIQVTGNGMPEDDPLSAAGTRISSIYLPMRSTQQSTSWVFSYKWQQLDYPEINDTISFYYDSAPYFSSQECGVIFKYHITKVEYTKHLVSSVEITDSLITNVDKEQIKIYFRTANGDDDETGEDVPEDENPGGDEPEDENPGGDEPESETDNQ